MKNILIPTAFEPDTLQAMKIASGLMQNDIVRITLMSVSPISDSITELLFLDKEKHYDIAKKCNLMETWTQFTELSGIEYVKTSEHHQFGISRPVIRQLFERFDTEMCIVPYSFHQSKRNIEKMLLRFLRESRIPIMLMPGDAEIPQSIHRALYLDGDEAQPASSMQNLPFHVIRQSMIKTSGIQSIGSMINNFKINLIVLAKGQEEKITQSLGDLGLPILTL